jgi:hypothetical protein
MARDQQTHSPKPQQRKTVNPVLTIKATKLGVEVILNALQKLPYEQSAGLIKEIEGQANYQLQQLAQAAAAPAAPEAATEPATEAKEAATTEGDAQ